MKYIFSILTILLFGLQTTAQKTNRVSFFYGISGNALLNSGLDGAPSYDGKGSTIFGLTYQRFLSNSLSLETGVEFSNNKIEIIPAYMPELYKYITKTIVERHVNIKMITIPVYANYTFLKYFYANAGILIDFEIDRAEYPKTDDQSGLGFGAGIGAQYTYQNFTLFVNPLIRYHAVIPNEKENHQQHLTETGVKFGLGYNF